MYFKNSAAHLVAYTVLPHLWCKDQESAGLADNDVATNCGGMLENISPKTLDMTDGDYTCINQELFSIVSMNVNSITKGSRVSELSNMCISLNADILLLQETKIDDLTSPGVFKIEGFNVEHRHRDRHGGGLLTYIRESIPFKRRKDLESKTIEHISLELVVNGEKLSVNNIYRPPNDSAESHESFLQEMSIVLDKIKRLRSATKLICGDMNFGNIYNRLGNLSPRTLDTKAPDLFLEAGMYQLIDIPTRQVNLSCSLIDLVFSSKLENVVLTATLPPVADHAGTLLCLNTLSYKSKPVVMDKPIYDEADWNAVKIKLQELHDETSDDCPDIERQTEEFSQKLTSIMKEHIPTKRVVMNEKDKPWFNREVKRKLRKRNRLHKNFRKYNILLKQMMGEIEENQTRKLAEAWHIKYKRASNDYNHQCRKSRANFFFEMKKTLNNPGISSMKKFQLLERVTNTGKSSYIPPLIEDNVVIHEPADKAKVFMDQFAAKSKLENYDDEAPSLEQLENCSSLSTILTSWFEVGQVIKNLKSADYSPCGVPSNFIKLSHETGSTLAKAVTKLLNSIFRAGKFPQCWKTAHITPIYKKSGAKTDKSNWRPISILATLSKICEAIIHQRLMGHLLENKIITDYQAAYLKGDSTSQQLLYLTNKVRMAWAKKQVAHAAFLDISAAFDKVWINGLMAKIKRIGVKGKMFELISSYLRNRKAVTVVEGFKSYEVLLLAGVPQGSRLGPILFLIMINDIITLMVATVLIFADDTTIIACGDNTSETVEVLNADLVKISDWAKKWKVKFNGSKSKDLIFSREKLNNSAPLKLDGVLIERVGSHKHLGLTLQPDLKWNIHLKKVIQHTSIKLSSLYNVKELSRKTLDMLYKLHIRSIMDYCLQVYGPELSKADVGKLDKVQYRAARLVTKTPKSTSANRLNIDLGWEDTQTRIKFLSLCHFYKIICARTRPLIRECLPPINQNFYNLRNSRMYDKYQFSDKILRRDLNMSFFPKVTNWWHELPQEVKKAFDDCDFAEKLRSHLIHPKNKLFNVGGRFGNSLHTQLRVGRSNLNSHLFKIGIAETTKCMCGHPNETAKHFLTECRLYSALREKLYREIEGCLMNKITRYNKDDLTAILLNGEGSDERIPYNKVIFKKVQIFLINTRRLVHKPEIQVINQQL